MTLQEFLDKLAKTPRTWKLGHIWRGEQAILDQWGRCPLQSIPHSGGPSYVTRLGIRRATTMRSMHAADDSIKHADYDPKLRARILEACGI